MCGSGARLVTTAIVADSRFPFPQSLQKSGNSRWIPTRSAMQRVLGLTRERPDFPSSFAAFRWISGMRRRLRGKENREGSKRSGVALRVGIQANREVHRLSRFRNHQTACSCLLVHCRGGLGRAGTIAARLLVELGMEPKQAIASVRAVRPGAIETSDQEDFVLGICAARK